MSKTLSEQMRDRWSALSRQPSMLLSTSTNTNNNQDSESEPESSVDAPNDAGEQEDRRRVVAESVEPEGISGRAERGQQQEPNGHEDRIADSEPPSERQPSKSAEPEAQANEAQQPAEEEEDEATLDAWAAFSDEYHDMVEQLPLEVQRAFRLISEMEQDTNRSLNLLQSSLTTYLAASQQSVPAAHVSELERVVHFLSQSTRNAGDRFSLASTMYETVDRHIQRLDADLSRLLEPADGLQDESMQTDEEDSTASVAADQTHDEGPGSSVSAGAPASKSLGKTIIKIKPLSKAPASGGETSRHSSVAPVAGPSQKKSKSSASTARKKTKPIKKRSAGVNAEDAAFGQPSASLLASLKEIPAAPDEPTYCYCNNVAMGDMVACDNEDCQKEWFHLECAGLEEAPPGEWYCRTCAQARGKNLFSKAMEEPPPHPDQDGKKQEEAGRKSSQRRSVGANSSSGEGGGPPKRKKR